MAKDFDKQWNSMIELRNRYLRAVAELPSREPGWTTPYDRLAVTQQELLDYCRRYHHGETVGLNQQKQRWQRLGRLAREDGTPPEKILADLMNEGCPESIAAGIVGTTDFELARAKAKPKTA